MKSTIIILAVLIVLGLAGAYYLHSMARGAKLMIIMNRLAQASADLRSHGSFTNDIPQYCEIYTFTEHYSIGGKDYQCSLAAKSPLFRGRGFMAVTTNYVLLWIDPKQGATQMSGAAGPW